MAQTSEDRARLLGRKHAVTGVPRQDQDGDGEAAIMTALGYRGPTTQANDPWRWRALEAYGEAYDRATTVPVTPAEARSWARWASPERAAAWLASVTVHDDRPGR